MTLVLALIGGNALLAAVQLIQVINGRRKQTAESDKIFVETATQIIELLKEEGKSKDEQIAQLRREIAELREEVHKLRSQDEVE